MYGQGILRGLGVTLKHFINTYVDDIKYGFRKYSADNFEVRQGVQAQGAFTVQYPDEKLAVPERFRFTPFLIVNDYDDEEEPGKDWCTSCGICAKVCPPQCIWIVRGSDPDTGRPVPQPEAFFIDIDICMNCGYCSEYCPFDAIKMDHDYEMASYDRTTSHIHDKERLSKEMKYWRHIAPTTAYEEMEARGGWEHTDVIKARKKAEKAAAKAAAKSKDSDGDSNTAAAAAKGRAEDRKSAARNSEEAKAERRAKREAALARKRAREAQEKDEE